MTRVAQGQARRMDGNGIREAADGQNDEVHLWHGQHEEWIRPVQQFRP